MGAQIALDDLASERVALGPPPRFAPTELVPPDVTSPDLVPARDEFGDPRFRALLPPREWEALPASIRRRFSKRLVGDACAVYRGEVLETRMSRIGWLLAQAARLIGAPLPLERNAHVAGVVSVTEDRAGGGQVWTRVYARRHGFPQVVHSAKRFAGPTGLEEYLGHGFGIALDVYVREGALIFRSVGYFAKVFGRRVMLPKWLCPGTMYVTHAELPDGKFSFTLQLFHPRFGLLVRQMAVFRETKS
jgi:Domain of unknown function (DUF4166)